MKSIHGYRSFNVAAPDLGLDNLKKRTTDAVMLSAVIAATVALYVVMLVSVYRWSRYAPIFPPDGAAGPAIGESIEWQ